MRTRTRSPWAGFRWLSKGIGGLFHYPKPLIGGALVMILISIIPAVVSFAMQHAPSATPFRPDATYFGVVMGISTVTNLLMMPINAGYMQMIDAAESGLPAGARDIFRPYANGEALRLIGFALLISVIYFALFAIVLATVGHGLVDWYLKLLTAQAAHQPPAIGIPDNFFKTLGLFMIVGLFMYGLYAVGLGQAALGQRSAFGAIRDGIVGSFKNVLALVVLALSGLVMMLVLLIVVAILAAIFVMVGKLLGPLFMLVMVIILDAALMLALFPIMFGTMYQMWRDVSGGDKVAGMAPTVAA